MLVAPDDATTHHRPRLPMTPYSVPSSTANRCRTRADGYRSLPTSRLAIRVPMHATMLPRLPARMRLQIRPPKLVEAEITRDSSVSGTTPPSAMAYVPMLPAPAAVQMSHSIVEPGTAGRRSGTQLRRSSFAPVRRIISNVPIEVTPIAAHASGIITLFRRAGFDCS